MEGWARTGSFLPLVISSRVFICTNHWRTDRLWRMRPSKLRGQSVHSVSVVDESEVRVQENLECLICPHWACQQVLLRGREAY